jgi:hypothetical protein
MMGTDANQASIAAHQKNIPALAASRGAFNHSQPPKVGSWSPGGTVKAKAPLALNPRTGRTFSAINPRW